MQSSAATCSCTSSLSILYRARVRGLLKVSGASASSCGSYTLARMTACGQTMTHLPHWMQMSSSHTGISRARLRFSHCAVPVGKVPSSGNALTGSSSPRPSHHFGGTLRTNSGATGNDGRNLDGAGGLVPEPRLHEGAPESCPPPRSSSARSLRPSCRSSSNRLFDASMASFPGQDAGNGEEASLHDGIDAAAHARSRATW